METPQPPQVSVSGRIVIEGRLPAPSGASSEKAPAPPLSPWWKFWKGWRDPHTRTANATLLLALGTLALATFSLIQISDFRHQERRQLRAYVFPSTTQFLPLKADGLVTWYMGPHWENSGMTPAHNIVIYFECLNDLLTKEGHVFDYQKMQKNADYYPTSLGPRQSTVGGICHFTADEIADFQKTGKVVYVGAEANYKDIFDERHLTRVCLGISLLGNPNVINPQIEHIISNCKRGNCDDEECRRQDRAPDK